MLSKILGLATLGGTWANLALFSRFLSSITTVVVLTVVSALLCCFLVMGVFFVIYFALVHYGLAPFVAAVTVAAVIVVLTVLMVVITVTKVRQLRDLSGHGADIPQLFPIVPVIEAFLEGFARHSPPKD